MCVKKKKTTCWYLDWNCVGSIDQLAENCHKKKMFHFLICKHAIYDSAFIVVVLLLSHV